MPRKCTICSNKQRRKIDAAIANSGTLRDIAGQFGVPKSTLANHAANCIAAATARVEANGQLKAAVAEAMPDVIATVTHLTSRAAVIDVLKQAVGVLKAEGLTQDHAVALFPKLTDQLAKHEGAYQAKAPNEEAEKRKAQRLQQRATEIAREFNRPVESVVQDLTAQLEQ